MKKVREHKNIDFILGINKHVKHLFNIIWLNLSDRSTHIDKKDTVYFVLPPFCTIFV